MGHDVNGDFIFERNLNKSNYKFIKLDIYYDTVAIVEEKIYQILPEIIYFEAGSAPLTEPLVPIIVTGNVVTTSILLSTSPTTPLLTDPRWSSNPISEYQF
jgi:hypothetical protein